MVTTEPSASREFDDDVRQEQHSRLQQSSQWEAELEAENLKLTKEVRDLKEKIDELRKDLYNARRSSERGFVDDDVQPEDSAPPETVEAAIDAARHLVGETLVLGGDVERSSQQLDATAGPPDKILRHLCILHELSMELRDGRPRKSIVQWITDKGISVSDDSSVPRRNGKAKVGRWNRPET